MVSFSTAVIRHPDKRSLRKKGFALAHSSRLESISTGRSRQQELGAAGHITSASRRQRAMTSCSALLPLSASAVQAMVHQSGQVCLPQYQPRYPATHGHAQRPMSKPILIVLTSAHTLLSRLSVPPGIAFVLSSMKSGFEVSTCEGEMQHLSLCARLTS